MNPQPGTKTDPPRPELDELMQRNIDAIRRIERAAHDARTRADRVSDSIAGFCGRPLFIYVHCAWFGAWLIWNALNVVHVGLRFDPPPFNRLTLLVSLEAIFLSTFILISQNRQRMLADQRNHLDLQINLLAEQESSQMLIMMKTVMNHLGIKDEGRESEALQEATDPEQLVEQIQQGISPTGDAADASA
ncbi:MAG: DUF1003 domain-containing protein [Fimbriimonas ginsengisoli]|uniref:DUF1003 domain-containing protein n=1 Tax=Fimbriimonas ginsengisoli TaxID=1005039 RepID=A0A931LXG8_FIMGI|nr:DUF1003 domain-containing protein [Fimbriimonas ginsengisoli]